jgi:hypothetical protein
MRTERNVSGSRTERSNTLTGRRTKASGMTRRMKETRMRCRKTSPL